MTSRLYLHLFAYKGSSLRQRGVQIGICKTKNRWVYVVLLVVLHALKGLLLI